MNVYQMHRHFGYQPRIATSSVRRSKPRGRRRARSAVWTRLQRARGMRRMRTLTLTATQALPTTCSAPSGPCRCCWPPLWLSRRMGAERAGQVAARVWGRPGAVPGHTDSAGPTTALAARLSQLCPVSLGMRPVTAMPSSSSSASR